jgi:alpha-L-arabinofuranosidase
LVHDVEDKMEKKEIYANAVEDMNGDVILRVVNISGENKKINILLKGLSNESILPDAEITVLTSDNLKDENSMDNPKKIYPQITTFNGVRDNFVYEFPKYSLTIIRIKKK